MTRSPSIRQASANAWRQASQDHTDDLGAVVDREEDSGRYSGVTGQRSGCSSSESTVRSRPLNHAGALLRRALDRSIREVVETVGFVRTIEDSREADFRLATPYAALWKSSIWRIQLVSGFHLGKIWATISKSLILND